MLLVLSPYTGPNNPDGIVEFEGNIFYYKLPNNVDAAGFYSVLTKSGSYLARSVVRAFNLIGLKSIS